jgi:hypothetical protein
MSATRNQQQPLVLLHVCFFRDVRVVEDVDLGYYTVSLSVVNRYELPEESIISRCQLKWIFI